MARRLKELLETAVHQDADFISHSNPRGAVAMDRATRIVRAPTVNRVTASRTPKRTAPPSRTPRIRPVVLQNYVEQYFEQVRKQKK